MKSAWLKINAKKNFGIFCIISSVVLIISCERPEPYPVIPHIQFENLTYHEIDGQDSLILQFEFQDGDGDLGIDGSAIWGSQWPYNEYFAITGNDFRAISISTSSIPDELYLSAPPLANFQFPQPLFTDYDDGVDLPLTEYNCYDYREVWITDDRFFYVPSSIYTTENVPADLSLDTILVVENQFHYNIFVDFYRKRGNEVELIDWRNLYTTDGCGGVVFNGRFPILDYDAANESTSLEGTVKYKMQSSGFRNIIRNDEFMIKFHIYDLRLNKSNEDSTGFLTLDEIIFEG